MKCRIAELNDLPQLKSMYQKLIAQMNRSGIRIWDEIYPCEYLKEDIENRRLYVSTLRQKIVSAFALCGSHTGAEAVSWENNQANAIYIDRLGVSADCLRGGIGSLTLRAAEESAREKGAEYLRLFVVDSNQPAIQLYIKNGFQRADGVYMEVIDEGLTLRELGFEIRV